MVRTVKEHGPISQRELLSLLKVKASTELKRAAIERAERLGGIRIDSEGQKHLHHFVKDLGVERAP